jgi:VWFA-related protein
MPACKQTHHSTLFSVGADLCVCPSLEVSQPPGQTHRSAPTQKRKFLYRVCYVSLALLLCATLVQAQSGRKVLGQPAAQKAESPIRINTTEVQLAVTVRDSLGRAVTGLQAADFSIYDNGKRYEPVHFEYRHVPVSLVLLLEASGGFLQNQEAIRQALLVFRRALAPADRLAVLQFTDEITLTQDWGNDEASLRKALKPALRPNGKAALSAALSLAAAKLSDRPGRRVILLLSGGLNTDGAAAFTTALMAVQSVAATVYAFSASEALATALRQQRATDVRSTDFLLLRLAAAEEALTALSELSGGKIFFTLQERSLTWMLADTINELRGQYWMSYAPDEEKADPRSARMLRVLVREGHQTYTRASSQWPTQLRFTRGAQFIPITARWR